MLPSMRRVGLCRSPPARREDVLVNRLLFLGLFLVIASFPALAREKPRGFDLNRIADLPTVPVLDEALFNRQTVLHEESPLGDASLAFRVRLPAAWVKAADFGQGGAHLSRGILGEVARYYSPPNLDVRSVFSVLTVQMDERMSLRNWMVNHALVQGFTLEGLREFGRDRVESQYVTIEGDINYRVRASAWMRGARIILALYKTPYSDWETEKRMQARCVSSFMPLAPWAYSPEGLDVHSLLDEMQFEYPLAWRLRTHENRAPERMKATLIHMKEGEDSRGWVNIVLVKQTPGLAVEKEVEAVENLVRKGGLVPGSVMETIEGWAYPKGTTYSRVDVRGALPENGRPGNYEIWRAILIVEGYLAIANMATPARDEMFSVWATNVEVFRRVLETLAPYDGKTRAANAPADAPAEATAPQWGEPSRSGAGKARIGLRQRHP